MKNLIRDVGDGFVRYRCGVISFDPFSFMTLRIAWTKIQTIDKHFGFILACNIVYHPISRLTLPLINKLLPDTP